MSKPFSFNFSTPSSGTTNTGGGLFGSSTTSTQPSTGIFGSPAPAASSGGAFGSTSTSSPFGGFNKPATTGTTSLFSSTPATSTTTPATGTGFGGAGGFSGFGSTTTTSTTQQAATTGFGGFGSGLGSTSTSLFGSTPQKQQTSLFSAGTTPGLGTSFTTQQQQQQNTTLLAQAAQQQAQTTAQTGQDATLNSLVNPQVFNDERDAILSRWNQLQTLYGYGKMFYQNSSIEVNKENQFNRFKTIGFSCKPTNKNEDGLVCLKFNKKENEVKANQKNITDQLMKIFNSDPSLSISVDSIKENEGKTQLVFYVKQRVSQLSDQTNRVASLMVYNHLNKQETPASSMLGGLKTTQTIKQQLEQLGVVEIVPLVGLTDEQIKSYLDNPPTGLNPILWDQAKKNNPNPKKLIPVQITGFQEINKRFKLQEQENNDHKESLNVINNSIESLNSKNKLLKSKIDQFKARNEDLEQRVLKVMINYEIRRKIGIPLQENEKYLLSILDTFQMELNSPINKEIQRQKLNEFVEIIKSYEANYRANRGGGTLQSNGASNLTNESIDNVNLNDIQKSLREQQKAFKSLIDIVNKDLNDLEKIKNSLGIEK